MTNPAVPIAAVPRIVDHEAFGRAIIRWALMKPELRPTTIGALKAAFPDIDRVFDIPDHMGDDVQVEMPQGAPDRLVVKLPALHKLLPMLAFLEQSWNDYVEGYELGFDPKDPPSVPSEPSNDRLYEIPQFFFDYVDDVRGKSAQQIDFVRFFLARVADYGPNGCR